MKEMYEKLWDSEYRNRSRRHFEKLERTLQLLKPQSTVANWGCGHGRLSEDLTKMGYEVTSIDIASNALNPGIDQRVRDRFICGSVEDTQLPNKVGRSVCTDVLEHLFEHQIDNAIHNIVSQTNHSTYFYIATIKDSKEIDGEIYILHPTVQNADWWSKKLSPHGLLTYERFTPHYYEAILWTS